ncbi:MAG: DUF4388 domain-containing protein [Candidatus Alcyoniella australis]|nr:DUF4388 domain-containing protein [Candidatus Alcyoniella australis]
MSQSEDRTHYMKGSLASVPTPKVIYFFASGEKTGVLALTNGKKKVHLHFNKGKLVYVTSSYFPKLSIGDFLAERNLISEDVNLASKEEIKRSKKKQGEWLLENNYITPHDLYQALNEHVRLKLLSVFEWIEGEYYFRDNGIIDEEYQVLNLNIPALIYEGVREKLPMNKMPREFRGRKESLIFKRPDPPFMINDLPMGPGDNRMFEKLVNGKLTLRQAVHASKMKPKRAYKILYALYMLGLIGFPENVGKTRTLPKTPAAKTPKPKASKGYEISIDEELISSALESVDRIRQEVTRDVESPDSAIGEDAARLAKAAEDEEEIEVELAEEVPDYVEEEPDDEPREEYKPEQEAIDDFSLQQDMSWDKDDSTTPPEEETEEPIEEPELPDMEEKSAEELLHIGQDLIGESNFDQAQLALQKAIELDGELAEAYSFLGWVQFNLDDSQAGLSQAEQTIKQGIKIKAGQWQAYLNLGKIYRDVGENEFAELHFVKCLEHNLDCQEARDEIRKIHNK